MKIKELREEKKLSQTKLAEIIQTSQRNIGRWENEENEPSFSQLVKLADFFECSIDYIVGREDDYGNVIAGQSTDQTLTKDENMLLEAFRSLGPFEREAILIQINALAGEKSLIKK